MIAEPEAAPHIWRDLSCLLALALAWRLLFLLGIPRVIDTADAIHYLESAQRMYAGDWLRLDPKIPLGYPALSALFHGVITDLESAARAASFIASLLLVVPVYLLARTLHGTRPARYAGVLVAIWPWLADYACRVSTEALAVTLWFTAVYLLLRAAEGARGAWPGAAAALAGLYLTRPEGLFICLAALPVFGLLLRGRGYRPLIGLVVVLASVIAANTLLVRTLTGETTANYRVGFIVEEFDVLRFVSTTVNTLSDVLPVMLGPVLLLFLGVGLFWPRTQPAASRAEGVLLYFALVQWLVTLPVLSPAPRYLMAVIVALSIWSARGLVIVSIQARGLRAGPMLRWLPAAALSASMLLGTAATIGGEYLGHRPRAPREYKEAGLWMKANLEPALIFTRKPQVAWYAAMPSTGPALDDSLEAALARARAADARYLVVDERYATTGLRSLLDPANAPASLELLYTNDTYPEARVLIYAWAHDRP